jgi:hypothetical protein
LDNPAITTKSDLFKTQRDEQIKQHIVFDSADRPVLIFTCGISTKDGEPCSVTEYVYRNSTSTQIFARQERVYTWKAAWDTSFIFNPVTNYDPDGDGNL